MFIWLLLPCQASEFPLLFSYILDSSFNSFFSFNLEKDTLFYIWQAVWTQPNQKPLAFQIASLVKEDKSPPSISFLEILWEGMSGMATAMLMAVIVDTSCLSGTLYPSLRLSPRYSIWRVCTVTFHHFAEGDTETPHGHMAYPRLQNRTCIQIYAFTMIYA